MGKNLLVRTLAAAAALALTATACASDDAAEGDSETTVAAEESSETTAAMEEEEATQDTEAMEEEAAGDTIVDIASGSEDFSILVEAVIAADLVDTLGGDGPFTVFAPTNEAFEAFLTENDLTKDELLASDDLAAILQGHVVGSTVDSVMAGELAEVGASVETLTSEEVLTLDGEMIQIGDATIVTADIEASNGVIHAIDQVLPLPDEAS